MHIIILGAKGFLGNHLLKYFSHINCIVQSIYKNSELSEISFSKIDVIINCAGASNVSNSFQDPANDFNKNTILVEQILEKIRASGNKKIKFINISSAAVYGNPQTIPIIEESIVDPISPYGYHKKMAEDLCRYYSRCFGLNTLSFRIFSAYG